MINNNPSWPPGKWHVTYHQEEDRYIIATEYDQFIASVGPTMIAHWLVRIYNNIFFV